MTQAPPLPESVKEASEVLAKIAEDGRKTRIKQANIDVDALLTKLRDFIKNNPEAAAGIAGGLGGAAVGGAATGIGNLQKPEEERKSALRSAIIGGLGGAALGAGGAAAYRGFKGLASGGPAGEVLPITYKDPTTGKVITLDADAARRHPELISQLKAINDTGLVKGTKEIVGGQTYDLVRRALPFGVGRLFMPESDNANWLTKYIGPDWSLTGLGSALAADMALSSDKLRLGDSRTINLGNLRIPGLSRNLSVRLPGIPLGKMSPGNARNETLVQRGLKAITGDKDRTWLPADQSLARTLLAPGHNLSDTEMRHVREQLHNLTHKGRMTGPVTVEIPPSQQQAGAAAAPNPTVTVNPANPSSVASNTPPQARPPRGQTVPHAFSPDAIRTIKEQGFVGSEGVGPDGKAVRYSGVRRGLGMDHLVDRTNKGGARLARILAYGAGPLADIVSGFRADQAVEQAKATEAFNALTRKAQKP